MQAIGWLALLVVALVVAWLATAARIGNKAMPGGYWGGLVAALIGGWIGGDRVGEWWWVLGGYNVIGGIIGSLILAYVVQYFGKAEHAGTTHSS